MYYGIKEGYVKCKSDKIINLCTDIEFYVDDAPIYFSGDFYDYELEQIIPNYDSINRKVEDLEWSKWTSPHYEYTIDFEKTRRGYRILHSNTTAEITLHFKPPREGTYKLLFGHGSTIASIIDAGTLRVGYIRANNGVDLTGYINDVSFPLENGSDTSQLSLTSSTEFEVLDDNELIVMTWVKTTDHGTGYLYLLNPILRRVS